MSEARVAIITGGASGLGLAVATAIGQRKAGWEIHCLDYNPAAAKAVDAVHGGVFHAVDVTDYPALGIVFRDIFRRHRRIDFVYANAGIAEINNEFFDKTSESDSDEPPPVLPKNATRVVDICLTAAIKTAFLAQHYFRLSPASTRGDRVLVFTASCGGLYPSYGMPIYGAAKHGVIGLARSLDPVEWRRNGIRVNAVCPGTVRTNLLSADLWRQFPDDFFTPIESVVKAVLIFLDGTDASHPEIKEMRGQAIECSGKNLYYHYAAPYSDKSMEIIMHATDTGE